LLGDFKVPRTGEDYDMGSEQGKKLTIAADMNELAHTELILLIDDKSISGKVTLNLMKACRKKYYTDGNARITWEKVRNKFEPSSAPSLVKLEKQSRQCSLKKGQNRDI
jgi:hypothetical protein